MRPALLALAGPLREEVSELALVEPYERRLDIGVGGEVMEALGACLELGDRLGTSQHQHGEHGRLGREEVERLVEEVAVFRDTRAGPRRRARPADLTEPLRCRAYLRLVVVDDRLAVRRLVAGEPQRVQRQRIL